MHNVKLKLFQIMMMSNNMENVAPHVIKVVARQVQTLAQEKMEGISLLVNEDDMTDIQVNIDIIKHLININCIQCLGRDRGSSGNSLPRRTVQSQART